MPYITQDIRDEVDYFLEGVFAAVSQYKPKERSGICNYIITTLLNTVYDEDKYDKLNTVVGILECAKMEFYRRRAVPYENGKMEDNGDVYDRTI